MPDIWLLLASGFYALAVYAIFRKILRRDGLTGFFRHVGERDTAGDDVILFALAMCFVVVVGMYAAAAVGLAVVREEWFITMRREWSALTSFVLALHFINGRLSKRIARAVKRARAHRENHAG